MKRLHALIRREFWENKGAFRTTPIVIGCIYIGFLLMSMFTTAHIDSDLYTFKDLVRQAEQQPAELRGTVLYQGLLFSSVFFTFVMNIVIFFYLLGALYDDRKDRSILFWKSLPASDTLTIASKLLCAMFLIPAFFFAALVLTHILMAAIGSIMILTVDVNPWELFISISSPFKAWGMIGASWLAQSVWALPAYGWLLMVSAFAPRVPLLFATLPPLVLAILQSWIEFLRTFTLQNNLAGVIKDWIINTPAILSAGHHDSGPLAGREVVALGFPLNSDFDHAVTIGNMLDRLFSMQMLWGLVVAAVFLGLALWLRHRATDN